LIDETGISVMPITSMKLDHPASNERLSSGIPKLDEMLGGKGYYRGSTVLVSGMAGTGKTSIAAHFAQAGCERGEKVLYFCFEESPDQFFRNMRSIGLDLKRWRDKGLLHVEANRPTLQGLEMHLVGMHKVIDKYAPKVVIVDPITNLSSVGNEMEVQLMLTRLIDFMKSRQITALFTSLTSPRDRIEDSEVGISSLIDSWLLVRDLEALGERNRALHILKSRGMPHSNQVREFLLTDHGVELKEVYLGPQGVLTGTARLTQEAYEKARADIQISRRSSLPLRYEEKKTKAGEKR
jgi:circadian clock protein KaiC